jgi:class 3 adenylate cyclase
VSVERWKNIGLKVEVIDLSTLSEGTGANNRELTKQSSHLGEAKQSAPVLTPKIMSLLFADALHFSKLTEEQIPLFLNHFLGLIAGLLNRTSHQPVMRNTWGDGLFMVFETVREAGELALELCDLINKTKWEEMALPNELSLRIALHSGPVFECIDPVSEKLNFFGSHVSRAARMEPITPPGQVYASQGFAALSAAHGVQDFVCDYVGQVPQAKGYGTFPTYHVHRSNR